MAAQAQTVRPEVVATGLQHPWAVAFFCFSEPGAGGNSTTLAPNGALWTHEHGPQGGDEINLPQPGRNYAWPVITYGENYGGSAIGQGLTAQTGMEPPLHYWVPSIAPSGMAFFNQHPLRPGVGWQSVRRLTEVWLPEPDRTGGTVRGQGCA